MTLSLDDTMERILDAPLLGSLKVMAIGTQGWWRLTSTYKMESVPSMRLNFPYSTQILLALSKCACCTEVSCPLKAADETVICAQVLRRRHQQRRQRLDGHLCYGAGV